MTDAELQRVRETVLLAIQDDEKGVPPMIRRFIAAHTDACPHGKSLYAAKWFVAGALAMTFIAGGSTGMALAQVLLR